MLKQAGLQKNAHKQVAAIATSPGYSDAEGLHRPYKLFQKILQFSQTFGER